MSISDTLSIHSDSSPRRSKTASSPSEGRSSTGSTATGGSISSSPRKAKKAKSATRAAATGARRRSGITRPAGAWRSGSSPFKIRALKPAGTSGSGARTKRRSSSSSSRTRSVRPAGPSNWSRSRRESRSLGACSLRKRASTRSLSASGSVGAGSDASRCSRASSSSRRPRQSAHTPRCSCHARGSSWAAGSHRARSSNSRKSWQRSGIRFFTLRLLSLSGGMGPAVLGGSLARGGPGT